MTDYRVRRPASVDKFIEAAVDPLTSAYAGARTPEQQRDVLASFTPGQRLLCAWYLYWDDVTNGGHAQYFANYTGDLWADALRMGDALGTPVVEILREAVALFPDGRPAATDSARQEQLKALDEKKFNELDERFYGSPGTRRQMQRYVEGHSADFFLEGGA